MKRASAALFAVFLSAASAWGQAYPTCGSAVNPCSYTPSTSSAAYGEPRWYYYLNNATYVASTNSVNVPAGDYATVLFCNTSTTKTVHIFRRRFDNNVPESVTAGFLYGGISGATTTAISSLASSYSVSGPTSVTTLSNLINTNTGSTNVGMSDAVGTSSVNGTIVATGYLPPSTPYELQEPRGLGPGTCQAQFAQNKSATTAYNVVLTIYWWEQ